MKKIKFTISSGSNQSSDEIHVSHKANTAFNPLKQKGGFKILKKLIYMKKLIISILVLVAFTTSLSAQITREQADNIVKEYLQNETITYNLLYVHVNTPSEEGIAITTSNE
ncbi:MAG: hypothetical protein LBG80_03480, partial [Bacteroidales bacterium]|nr:hypothetical protein [Bacteroidales bacterium]